MSAKILGIVPRRAVFAAAMLSMLSPWSTSHAAVALAQLAPQDSYNRQAGPPASQRDAGTPPPNAIRPSPSGQWAPQIQNAPRANVPPGFRQPNAIDDLPADGRGNSGLTI